MAKAFISYRRADSSGLSHCARCAQRGHRIATFSFHHALTREERD
jgi:hypothetical protein